MLSLMADEDEFSNQTWRPEVRGVHVASLWDAAPVSCLNTEASGPAGRRGLFNVYEYL